MFSPNELCQREDLMLVTDCHSCKMKVEPLWLHTQLTQFNLTFRALSPRFVEVYGGQKAVGLHQNFYFVFRR